MRADRTYQDDQCHNTPFRLLSDETSTKFFLRPLDLHRVHGKLSHTRLALPSGGGGRAGRRPDQCRPPDGSIFAKASSSARSTLSQRKRPPTARLRRVRPRRRIRRCCALISRIRRPPLCRSCCFPILARPRRWGDQRHTSQWPPTILALARVMIEDWAREPDRRPMAHRHNCQVPGER
jgi:hypothetical protein